MFSGCKRRESKRRAFTLIELLVVISIIALIAAILFPVFARARENARRTSCASNLKQIGLGVAQYTQDYDERFPPFDNTDALGAFGIAQNYAASTAKNNAFKAVSPYLKNIQIFACPSAVIADSADYPPTSISDSSYPENGIVTGRSLAVISTPSSVVHYQELNKRHSYYLLRPMNGAQGSSYCGGAAAKYSQWHGLVGGVEVYNNQHFSGGNLLFCDSHVKWRSYSSLSSSDFGLVDGSGNGVAYATANSGDTCLKPAF